MPNELFGNREAQQNLAKDISAFFRDQRLGEDAEPVPPPERPSVEGLKPEVAAERLAEHEANQKLYLDYLLKRPGMLSAQEQAFIGRAVREWNAAGRPE